MRIFRKQPSHREILEANQRASDFYADSFGKPRMQNALLAALPPKRERIRRPVDNKPVCSSEHQEQCTVIAWWRLQHELYELPEFALTAIPNGGARDAITGARLKAEGVRRGAPDLILAKPKGAYHGLLIEMKAVDGRESTEQRDYGTYLNGAGYKFAFCYGATSAIETIKEYLA